MKHNYTMIKLMFVCLGNICRSPLAEAVLKNKVLRANLDYIVVMDDSNRKNVVRIKPTHAVSAFFKLRDFDTQDEGSDVIDPWFGDEDGFEECYQTIDRCTDELLLFLMNKHHLAKG